MSLAAVAEKLASSRDVPSDEGLPVTEGNRFAAGSVVFERSNTKPYDRHHRTDFDIFGINIEPSVVHTAFDSDAVRERFCRPYGLAFHPARSNYYYRRDHEGQAFYCFATTPEFRTAIFEEFGLSSADVRTVFKISSPEIVHLTHQIEGLFVDPGSRTELEAELIALNVVAQVARAIAGRDASELRGTGRAPAERITRAIEFLLDHLADPVKLSDVAEASGLSRYHFSRAFKEMTGESPMRFLLTRRIVRARSLLADPSKSLAGVAQECGFASQSHFTTLFRQEVGRTPGAYRSSLER